MLLLVDVASAGREVGCGRARIQRSRPVHRASSVTNKSPQRFWAADINQGQKIGRSDESVIFEKRKLGALLQIHIALGEELTTRLACYRRKLAPKVNHQSQNWILFTTSQIPKAEKATAGSDMTCKGYFGWDRNRSVNAFATTVSREWTFTDPAAGQIYISTPHRIGSTHEDAGEGILRIAVSIVQTWRPMINGASGKTCQLFEESTTAAAPFLPHNTSCHTDR